ncbi:hypothetical protein KY285_021052 [Solanum tuberosum]|nr:hypothetical protein KY284_021129 [Solanum tuberosum]KAH0683527.1 hypothetical protein KY289_021279 [Solanum tuberosum]KAH0693955.1 hypothetical protein KY285_021052 [Solanum tuberosum]
MGASLAIALKCFFAILGCLVTGIVIYTIAIDGFSFVITPLMAATTIDSYIHVFLIWVAS